MCWLVCKVSKDDLMDSVQGLGQSITSASSIAGEALKRCLQFTEGTGFCGLIKALQVRNSKCNLNAKKFCLDFGARLVSNTKYPTILTLQILNFWPFQFKGF